MTLFEYAELGNAEAINAESWTSSALNERGPDGRTALMHAAIRGDYRVAQALRQAGADLHLTDRDGRKAVHLAALYGHSVVIATLIEGGCGG